MSYLVLARKYRPGTFTDLVGQEVVARTLQGAIEEDRVGHAYLFSGPRGTGKTTTARIFAKALNCVNGPTPNPCGVCGHCEGIDKGADPDLIEMDAASNRRIEDVRELRENVAYAPMRARFKVYIIDEVHMMTKEAFNALLKTLEEPPRHVKFLLATTDPQKVPATILSRCQILRLSPMSEAVITARLEWVFERENVRAEPGVSAEIARRARGGMRDALSMADQLLSLVGSEPKLADVERLAAEGGAELADTLLDCLAKSDRAGVIEALPVGEGGEAEIVGALLDRLRAVLLIGLLGRDAPQVQVEAEERAELLARAETIGLQRIHAWIEELILARERMARLPAHGRVVLEVALIDLAREETGMPLAELERRLIALEARLSSSTSSSTSSSLSSSTSSTPSTSNRAGPSNRAALSNDVLPRPATPATAAPTAAPALRDAAPALRDAVEPSSRSAQAPTRAAVAAPTSPRTTTTVTPTIPRAAPEPVLRAPAPVADDAPSSRDDGDYEREHASESERGYERGADTPRPRIAGNADAWERFLAALAKDSPSLAEALRARGKLVDLANGRALIQLANLRENERALVFDAQNERKCRNVFSTVLGVATSVVLEDKAASKKTRDAYTGKVAELFGDRIEDDA